MALFDNIKKLFGGGSSDDGGVAMISCEDALEALHEYLDGELDAIPSAEVEAHFEMCQRCYPHLHLETVFRDSVARAAGGAVAPPELMAKVKALLEEAEGS